MIWGPSGTATDIGMGKLGEMNLKLTCLILHISAVSWSQTKITHVHKFREMLKQLVA